MNEKIKKIQYPSSRYLKDQHKTVSVNKLLERTPDEEYIAEWTKLLAESSESFKESRQLGLVLFRLGQEWLALSALVFREVSEMRKIHLIPHRSGKILKGIVNLRGQLKLCVAIDRLLDIDISQEIPRSADIKIYQRMLAIQKDDEHWIFPVSEVHGIYHINPDQLQNVPVTISKSSANYMKGVIEWNNQSVGCLDEDLLFFSLKKSLL